MAFDRKKFLARFVEEAREQIDKINEGLLNLEKNNDDMETLNAVFRSAHTIKGTSRMMKLTAITEIAHKLEDALDALREKKIQHSKELADIFLKGVDTISEMVDQTDAGQEITIKTENICEKLEEAANGEIGKMGISLEEKPSQQVKKDIVSNIASQPEISNIKESKPEENLSSETASSTQEQPAFKSDRLKIDKTIRIETGKLDETIKLMGEMLSYQSRLKQRVIDFKEIEKLSRRNKELVSLAMKEDTSYKNGLHGRELINVAQSLCIKIKQIVANSRDDAIFQELQAIDLQEKALRMRMLPLSIVFDKFHREVRDMSRSLAKDVDFVVEGGETELDKSIVEKLGDPIMHMIRNSIHHGIENPEDRLKEGKAVNGTIRLSAYYEGGNVLIEVSDDGAGIPLKKIKEKALHKNMFSEDELKEMPESKIIELIFQPGFTTCTFITDISGRGVGMDVVRKNIVEDLKGAVSVESKESKGACFLITLPLTLSIIRVLKFTVSNMAFAIPVNYVTEILRIPESEIIDVVNSRAIRLREQIIPVANVSDLLAVPNENQSNGKDLLIIMTNFGSEMFGLIVDSLVDEEDMVTKSLPSHMKNIQWVTGVAISGKDEIISILNIPAIIKAARDIKTGKTKKKIVKDEDIKSRKILIVDDSVNTREIEKSVLESYGYSVDVAEDGIDALEKTNDFKYDLVVTDIEMPRMDGLSLTEKLRSEKEYKHTPIIILTSREKEEDKRRGMQAGANAYITKGSFDQSNLLDTVQNLIS